MTARFFHRARVRAPIEVVWDVFTDHERMGEYCDTPMKIVEPGHPDRNGLGCVREMIIGLGYGWPVTEIVNYWEPGKLYGYHILGGATVTHHQGVVRFFPTAEGGTEWVYDMRNTPTESSEAEAAAAGYPDWQTFVYVGFRQWVADLEAECERRSSRVSVPAYPPSTKDRALQLPDRGFVGEATRYRFFHRARVRAPVSVCWEVFTNHERVGEFTGADMPIIQPGQFERNGLGCVRHTSFGAVSVPEIVNYWHPNELFGYHVVDCQQILNHQGVVRFYPTADGGTEWVYDMQIVPGETFLSMAKDAGKGFHDFMNGGFLLYAKAYEAECERRAAGEDVPNLVPSVSDRTLPKPSKGNGP